MGNQARDNREATNVVDQAHQRDEQSESRQPGRRRWRLWHQDTDAGAAEADGYDNANATTSRRGTDVQAPVVGVVEKHPSLCPGSHGSDEADRSH
jgi:hypothetical protein